MSPSKTTKTSPEKKKKVAPRKAAAKKTSIKKNKRSSATQTAAKLSKVDIFAGLSKNEILNLSKLMTEISVPEGKILVKQGAHGSEFMLIVSGRASVVRNRRKIAELGAGNFVGELSIIGKTPRYATVTAKTDMVIRVLTPQEFMSMLDKNPKIAKKILIEAIARLQQMADSKAKI